MLESDFKSILTGLDLYLRRETDALKVPAVSALPKIGRDLHQHMTVGQHQESQVSKMHIPARVFSDGNHPRVGLDQNVAARLGLPYAGAGQPLRR